MISSSRPRPSGPGKCFDQPLRLHDEAAVRALPQSQIVCTSTLPYRDPADLEPARAAGRLWDIDTSHDLMVSEPQAVAGFPGAGGGDGDNGGGLMADL
ncbi:hypothetical protein OG588_26090 [Streptomyces prunicolor]|uniref:hypothetical protein n=1 Tax=Streptomyces prunicolor TaxID=67348 RepID=UPI003867ECC0|nr:hypothetical protein OG588_26090 [Streptomyces prunicolor]